ncbi:hypothetical protein BJP34_24595 [Moorena producens PAL-8-15-08-1]|uniref:DUF5666 domain-containing protein n=1 Tax=Moorena producens PAL-8-15-08-1 TaxID=1458985 RepID=A0A1D8TX89_9CYAN|nr:hypothetical protein [Moorena producens]AOX02194.1 hypothetical protein BJP34_24595 [Moorena producens PAL-8-15-08-1]
MTTKLQIPFKSFAFSSLIGLSLLFSACSAPQPDVSPENNQGNNPDNNPIVTSTDEQMIIEGKIVAVMESFPLQLKVETQSGSYSVQLLSDTKITRQGETVDPGKLSPDQKVRIKGQSSASSKSAMTAQTIEIR